MSTQEKRPMLSFFETDLPRLPIVDLISFANIQVKSLDHFPHVVIELVDNKTTQLQRLYVRFDNSRWDNQLHDPLKLSTLFDGWLESLIHDLEVRSDPHTTYDFVGSYPAFRAPPSLYQAGAAFRRPPSAFLTYAEHQARQGWNQPSYWDPSSRAMFAHPNLRDQPSAQNPRSYARWGAANNLLTQFIEHSNCVKGARLQTTWEMGHDGKSQFYIEGDIGGGVGLMIQHKGFSDVERDSNHPVPMKPDANFGPITGMLTLGENAYTFAFYHRVLGMDFRQSVSNSILMDAFNRVWERYAKAQGLEARRVALSFDN